MPKATSTTKRPKHENVLGLSMELWKQGRYRILPHALDRQDMRRIDRFDIEQTLKEGYREKSKDQWNSQLQTWRYAVRCDDVEERRLRIIVSFEPFDPIFPDNTELLVIITVIDIDGED